MLIRRWTNSTLPYVIVIDIVWGKTEKFRAYVVQIPDYIQFLLTLAG